MTVPDGRGAPGPGPASGRDLPAHRSVARRLGGNVVALSGGAAVQRVVALLAQLSIARIVGPSALGALAVAQALILLGAIFTDGGLTTLALRRIVRDPGQLSELASVTLAVQAGLAVAGIAVLDVVALVGPWPGRTATLILALSPSLLCSAYNMSYVLKASERMGAVAAYRALASVVPSVVSVVLVAATRDTLWVALSTDAGLLLSAALIHRHLRRHFRLRLVRVSRQQMRTTLREGVPFLISAALLIVPPTAGTVVVGIVLGDHAAGLYSAAWQLSFAAVTVAALVVDAIYPEMVRRWDRGGEVLAGFLALVLRLICRVLFPLTVVVVAAATPVTRLLFGSDFDRTAPLLQILVVTIPIGFVWVVLGQALTAANSERLLMRRTSLVTVSTLVALPLAARLGGLTAVAWTVLALAVVQASSYAGTPLIGRGRLLVALTRELPYALVPAALCVAARALGGPTLLLDLVAAGVGVLLWEAVRKWPTVTLARGLRPGGPNRTAT